MKKIILILLLATILIQGCGQKTTADIIASANDQFTGEIKEFEMIAKQWEFIPEAITVNLGDKVDIHVKSVDVTHGFALPEFGINERLEPGKEAHIEFVADKKGIFRFACSVPCGSGHERMSGKLIVE